MRPGETQVNDGGRPRISTARLFLPRDKIMTFDRMCTVTWRRFVICVYRGIVSKFKKLNE